MSGITLIKYLTMDCLMCSVNGTRLTFQSVFRDAGISCFRSVRWGMGEIKGFVVAV